MLSRRWPTGGWAGKALRPYSGTGTGIILGPARVPDQIGVSIIHRVPRGTFIVAVAIALLGAGCGGGDDAISTLTTEAPTTTAPMAGPPCYGLPEVGEVPIVGGLAVGETHALLGGGQIDLTGLVGCGLDGGVVTMTADGVFDRAYMDNCDEFGATDIPVAELRPPSDTSWACVQDPGNGDLIYSYTLP